jgi:hypothetical protein
MFYTPVSSFDQLKIKRLNKKFDLACLPVIDPRLISIVRLASRLISEADNAFTAISNASSNDGLEVIIFRHYGGIPSNPAWFKEEAVELDAAFNILIGDTFDHMINSIRDWHYKATRKNVGTLAIFDSRFDIEPPDEIKTAVRL